MTTSFAGPAFGAVQPERTSVARAESLAGPPKVRMFEYQARTRTGKLIKGRGDASNETALVARLRTSGVTPVRIKEVGTGLNREITLPWAARVKLKDLAIMTRQLATMMQSGLPMLRSMSILAEQTASPSLAKILTTARTDIERGQSLSSAVAKHPDVFTPLMINLIRAGEVGGFLDSALLSIAANVEAEVKLRGKVKSAMTYPVVVFALAIASCIAMLTFIVPVFVKMFAGLGGTLPLATRVLVTLSSGMKYAVPLGIVLGIAGAVAWRHWKRHPRVRNLVDPMRLKIPVFGSLAVKIALARFCRNLSTMTRSGVPILQALEIVGATSGNVVIERAVADVRDAVRRGESMAGPLSHHKVFPSMVVQMLAVGEDTGAIDTMLEKVAVFYDAEVESTTEALTSLIEPLMIAGVGLLIGGMIVALYLPIFTIYNQVH